MPYKCLSAQAAAIGETGWSGCVRSVESASATPLSEVQRIGFLLQEDPVGHASSFHVYYVLIYVFLFFYFIEYFVQYKSFFTVVIVRCCI